MKIIKRYKNRRLYDTDLKEYITHAELSRIIGSKTPFKVIDSRTGRDITTAVLGQMLIREIKGQDDSKDIREILTILLCRGGAKSMSILKDTYLASIGMFNLTKKKAEEVIDTLIKAGEISKSERKQAVLELLDKAEKSTSKMKEKIVKETGNVQKDVARVVDKFKLATRKDIEAINKKIDKLMKAIDKMEKSQ